MDKQASEIVKLTERISKDPKSKLFVPLAEEYKKAGDVEMAVYVLTEGLKHNPGYVTARAILGRLLFEQGDLSGAQRELEEVVKVIPDNLLAQRKLGDICVLQNRQQEALKYYEILLSLNPRDQEVASLIADIKAGRGVSQKISHVKVQSAAGQVKQEETPKAPASPASAQVTEKNIGAEVVSTPVPESKSPVPSETAQKAVNEPNPEGEEPEEIFAVEPLEEEKKQEERGVAAFAPESAPEKSSPESDAEKIFAGVDADPAAALQGDEIRWQPQEEGMPGAADVEPAADKAGTTAATSAPAEKLEETVAEKTDDFTTDTLAELYIAQGFYEKAIDIYERMFADKPTSRGLKEKLERVKAMAAASTESTEQQVEATPVDIFAEPALYSAQEEPEAGKPKPQAFPVQDEPRAEVRPVKEPVAEFRGPAATPPPAFSDFEPREYAPPPKPEEEKVQAKANNEEPAAKSSGAIRKETIDRLESWLKNIKKE